MTVGGDGSGTGVEAAVLLVVGVGVVVVGCVWVGAALAAALSGHPGLGVGLAAAFHALPSLVRRPGSPARAWPAAVQGRLPGPVLYWGCTAPIVAAAVAAAVLAASLIARRRTVGLQPRTRMGLRPEARFARAADLAPLWVPGPAAGRLVLGRVEGHLVATEDRQAGLAADVPWWLRKRAESRSGDRGAVAVFGPTRCGKTTALAVPGILEWAGPVIALSVKSDLMGATIDARRRRGEVKVFDPADATVETSCSWSPLRSAGTLSGAKKAAHAVANATDWTAASGDMAFWVAGAEDLLAPLFFVARCQRLPMGSVVRWVLNMERPDAEGNGSEVATLVEALANGHDPAIAADARAAAELLTGTWGLDPKQLSSVYVTAKAMVTAWQDPTVAAASVGPAVDLDWLLAPTDAGGGNTLYLCAPLHEANRLAPVLGGLLADLIQQAYERHGKSNEALGPILIVVDEAGNWPLKHLAGLASTCAGIGILLVLIFQSKAQLDAVYGRQADTIISNCLTKVFFAGLSDRSTLDYAESLLGHEQVLDRHSSVDVGGGSGRRSLSQSTTRAELLPMALLRQVRPGEALLVHNTLPPAHLIGRYWFKDPALYQVATGDPLRRRLASRQAPATADQATSGDDTRRRGGRRRRRVGSER